VIPDEANTLITNWPGHGQFSQTPHLLETTSDKRVVWSYANHADMRKLAAVQVLGAEGQVLLGEMLRYPSTGGAGLDTLARAT
jgi:hypothetical protein